MTTKKKTPDVTSWLNDESEETTSEKHFEAGFKKPVAETEAKKTESRPARPAAVQPADGDLKMVVTGKIKRAGAKKVLVELPQDDYLEIQKHVAGSISVVVVELVRYALEHIKAQDKLIMRDASR